MTACERCPHDFDDHQLIASNAVSEGGILRCPVPLCGCVGTWGINGKRPDPRMVDMLLEAAISDPEERTLARMKLAKER